MKPGKVWFCYASEEDIQLMGRLDEYTTKCEKFNISLDNRRCEKCRNTRSEKSLSGFKTFEEWDKDRQKKLKEQREGKKEHKHCVVQ